ncbi:hypothetical protein CAEBREN_03171 [Caenorhabditis brenneri]|uniref:Uncharacterized protein n=1 Tax=Caenorhabditis brenneri TaxID=135651 RepID=G0N002_CAEBE|nr:hypothetical protein CAEBREN_03171 [Caenorhabditis brenneri]
MIAYFSICLATFSYKGVDWFVNHRRYYLLSIVPLFVATGGLSFCRCGIEYNILMIIPISFCAYAPDWLLEYSPPEAQRLHHSMVKCIIYLLIDLFLILKNGVKLNAFYLDIMKDA